MSYPLDPDDLIDELKEQRILGINSSGYKRCICGRIILPDNNFDVNADNRWSEENEYSDLCTTCMNEYLQNHK